MTRFIRTIATLAITVFVAAWLAAQTQGVDILLSKARSLEAQGVKELCLVAQDTTRYGQDLGLAHGLTDLLRSAESKAFAKRVLASDPVGTLPRMILARFPQRSV